MWKEVGIGAAAVLVALYALITAHWRARAVLALERLVRLAEREP